MQCDIEKCYVCTERTTLNYLDFTSLDHFLFVYLKIGVYGNWIHNLDVSEAAVTHEVQNITEEFCRVYLFDNLR